MASPRESEKIANSQKRNCYYNYIESSKYESKLFTFISVLDIMETEIGSEHRLIHVLQETIHCIL